MPPIRLFKRVAVLLSALLLAAPLAAAAKDQPYEHYVYGALNTPTPGPVSGGLLLMGGGDRNIDAMKWFFGKAGKPHGPHTSTTGCTVLTHFSSAALDFNVVD